MPAPEHAYEHQNSKICVALFCCFPRVFLAVLPILFPVLCPAPHVALFSFLHLFNMRPTLRGFTLIEIAVVLVIIGLILGGVFKGQEMIVQAKIRNAISDYHGVAAAYQSYQDRYHQLPGDDPTAGTRWANAVAGNGDGIVSGAYNVNCEAAAAANIESCLWWDHLRRAGFISGVGRKAPINATAGLVGVQTGDGMGGMALGGLSGLLICSANLPEKIAIAIDLQLDDGLMDRGTVRSLRQTTPNPAIPNDTTRADYAENGANIYVVCRAL